MRFVASSHRPDNLPPVIRSWASAMVRVFTSRLTYEGDDQPIRSFSQAGSGLTSPVCLTRKVAHEPALFNPFPLNLSCPQPQGEGPGVRSRPMLSNRQLPCGPSNPRRMNRLTAWAETWVRGGAWASPSGGARCSARRSSAPRWACRRSSQRQRCSWLPRRSTHS
jgi:hypothetical protein